MVNQMQDEKEPVIISGICKDVRGSSWETLVTLYCNPYIPILC